MAVKIQLLSDVKRKKHGEEDEQWPFESVPFYDLAYNTCKLSTARLWYPVGMDWMWVWRVECFEPQGMASVC